MLGVFFFFKQKTEYEMRISDWSSDVCSSDLGQVYEYELSQVKVGMAATVVLPEMPGHTFAARVSYVYPYLERATRTARVRVELPNPDGLLRPDMYANLYLEVDLGERLVVPEAAVLYAGESRVVFLDLGDGHLQPRKIRTGLRNG